MSTKRIAIVATSSKVSDMRADKQPFYRAFFDELNRLGFIEGQNLVVERYSAEGRKDRHVVEEMAREVVGTHPDVIVLFSNVHALAFKEATTVIPIVASTADPVATGVTSPVWPQMLASKCMRSGSNFSKNSPLIPRALLYWRTLRTLAPFWIGWSLRTRRAPWG